jgi:hypothetical protein
MRKQLAFTLALCLAPAAALAQDKPWVTYDGTDGPGDGKHIVLVSGDEEYRSEESLPQLGRILAKHHGFKCTVLFPIHPDTGKINPNYQKNIPGLHHLDDADLMVIFTRFRNLPDDQMEHIDKYLKAGKPVVGMRTSTHAFRIPGNSKWKRYSNGYNGPKEAWKGGFGRLVLGEMWISHHGAHRSEATRGVIDPKAKDHPLANGLKNSLIFGPTDVYGVRLPLPDDSQPIIRGEVVDGMSPDDPAVEGKKNDPMMPVTWTKSYKLPEGKEGDAFTTTMGTSKGLKWEGTRRMIINGCFWALDMDVPEKAKVEIVGDFDPTMYGFGNFQKNLTPDDFRMEIGSN